MRHILAVATCVLLAGCAANPKGEPLAGGLGSEPPESLVTNPAVAARTGAVRSSKVIAESDLKSGSPWAVWSHGKAVESRTWKVEGEQGTVYLEAKAAHGSNGRWVLTDYRILSPSEAALVEAAEADGPAHWSHTVLDRPVALKRDPTDEAPEVLLKDHALLERVGTVTSVVPTASSITSETAEAPDFTQSTTYRIAGDKGVAYAEIRAEKKTGKWWVTGYAVYPPKVVTKLEGVRASGK